MSFKRYWQYFEKQCKGVGFPNGQRQFWKSQSTKHSRKVCTPWGTLNLGIWWRWPMNQKLGRPQSWCVKSGEGRTPGSEPQLSSSKLFTGHSQVIPGTKSIYNRQCKICDIWYWMIQKDSVMGNSLTDPLHFTVPQNGKMHWLNNLASNCWRLVWFF